MLLLILSCAARLPVVVDVLAEMVKKQEHVTPCSLGDAFEWKANMKLLVSLSYALAQACDTE